MGFYDDPDMFDTQVKGSYYDSQEQAPGDEEAPKLRFRWWEWLIIAIEIGLVTYTVLVLLRIAPLF